MSYTIQDVSGNKMPGPTISGLNAMSTLVQTQSAQDYPVTSHLLEFGHTTKLTALAVECTRLADKTDSEDEKHSLLEFARYARDFNRTPGNMLIITH